MSSSINFFSEEVTYTVKNKETLRKWFIETAEKERVIAGDINFIICNDEFLYKLNKFYLKHDTLTDIITFPLMDDECIISGDIYISIDRIRENARLFKETIFAELSRVMIHGILHLLGYDDSSAKDRQLMRKREDFYLQRLKENIRK